MNSKKEMEKKKMLIIQWITINEIEEYDFDLYYDTK